MLKPRLCDYSDVYILASGTIKIDGAGADIMQNNQMK